MKIRRNMLPLAQVPELAEIKVWGPWVFATVLWKIGAQFELTTGYQLDVISDLPATYAKWMNAGEPFDVFIGTSSLVDELIENGKIAAETRASLGRSPIGVEVRAGAAKPDIGFGRGIQAHASRSGFDRLSQSRRRTLRARHARTYWNLRRHQIQGHAS